MSYYRDSDMRLLIEKAFAKFEELPPEDQALHRLAQKASFAYGSQSLSTQTSLLQHTVDALAVRRAVEGAYNKLPNGAMNLLKHLRVASYLPVERDAKHIDTLRQLGLVYVDAVSDTKSEYFTTYLGDALYKWERAGHKWEGQPAMPARLSDRTAKFRKDHEDR